MKKYIKKIGVAIVILFIGIQFIPKNYNKSNKISTTDFITTFNAPKKIASQLKISCYDCHSNNTIYPWYHKIQPVALFMEDHIDEGKEELNFSEFGRYSKRKQKLKLKAIINEIKDDEMPLWSYTLIHRNAIISEKNKKFLEEWLTNLRDSLK